MRRFSWLCVVGLFCGACSGSDPACPEEGRGDVACVWEGPVSSSVEGVSATADAAFVSVRLEWAPCGATPGVQHRTYRIDPATGETQRTDVVPPEAMEVPIPATGTTVEIPLDTTRIELDLTAMDSVLSTQLQIGRLLNRTTGGLLAQVRIDVVCGG